MKTKILFFVALLQTILNPVSRILKKPTRLQNLQSAKEKQISMRVSQ